MTRDYQTRHAVVSSLHAMLLISKNIKVSRFLLLLGHGAQPKMTYSPIRREYIHGDLEKINKIDTQKLILKDHFLQSTISVISSQVLDAGWTVEHFCLQKILFYLFHPDVCEI